MKISTIVKLIAHTWAKNPHQPILLESMPGGGKTEVAIALPKLIEALKDHTPVICRPSDRDSTDFLGVPNPRFDEDLGCDVVYWAKPGEMARFETGKWILIWDEIPDAPVASQNVICAWLWGRASSNITLGDDVLQILTGNPVEARSGANRLITKLVNRVLRIEQTTDTQDWRKWGYNNGVSPEMLAFIALRGELLHKFDPSAASNPSPRSVTCLDKGLDFNHFELNEYLEAATGYVGNEFAGEYTNFIKLLPDMPDIADIIANPGTAHIPTDPSLHYAIATAFTGRVDNTNIDPMFDYMARDDWPKDFRAMFISDMRLSDRCVAEGLHEHKRVTDLAIETQSNDMMR